MSQPLHRAWRDFIKIFLPPSLEKDLKLCYNETEQEVDIMRQYVYVSKGQTCDNNGRKYDLFISFSDSTDDERKKENIILKK